MNDWMRPRTRGNLVALGLVVGLTTFAVAERDADAAAAYVRSTVGAPWNQSVNEQAMDMVFGMGGWDDLRYETVDPLVLLSPTYGFIYFEGSDDNALELQTFMMANQAAMEAWVTAGGDMFLNAAPNEGGSQMWGFGGVTLNYPDSSVNPGSAADDTHPIWNGPFLPTTTVGFTGSAFAHATVSGPGLIPHIYDSNGGNPHLAETTFGAGVIMFGGLTTSNYWTPAPDALNLRANIIAYLAGEDTDGDGLIDAVDNCPEVPNPMQDDSDMDGLGDACDICPGSPINDEDDDGTCDDVDNCLGLANPSQADDDMDGQGNECDECPGDPDDDADNDTICGDMDNCPNNVNVNQADDDMDGLGNLCDPCPDDDVNDPDEDGACDATDDNCPGLANEDQADADGDGVGDACDACPGDELDDADGDGVCGDEDNCPDVANADQADEDGDGVGDACDTTGDDTSGGGTGTGDSTGGDPDTGGAETTGDGTGGGTGLTGLTGIEPPDPAGCGCTSDGDGERGGAAWWLLPLAGVFARRRRRAA